MPSKQYLTIRKLLSPNPELSRVISPWPRHGSAAKRIATSGRDTPKAEGVQDHSPALFARPPRRWKGAPPAQFPLGHKKLPSTGLRRIPRSQTENKSRLRRGRLRQSFLVSECVCAAFPYRPPQGTFPGSTYMSNGRPQNRQSLYPLSADFLTPISGDLVPPAVSPLLSPHTPARPSTPHSRAPLPLAIHRNPLEKRFS